MMECVLDNIELLVTRYPVLKKEKENILQAYLLMEKSFSSEGKLLIAGNGGSAADSEHIVGELMKGFKKSRNLKQYEIEAIQNVDKKMGEVICEKLQGALPTIALDGHPALMTAYMNDCDPMLCFAQQLNGLGRQEDVFLGISTSGNSKNVIYAAIVAKAKGMKVIGLTGANNSKLEQLADVCVKVPENETYMVQELHLPIYHCWCLMLEEKFFE